MVRKQVKYIDTHAHYYFRQFNKDLEMLLLNLHSNRLEKVLSPAISSTSNFQMKDKPGKYDWTYYSVGIHQKYVEMDYFVDEGWIG